MSNMYEDEYMDTEDLDDEELLSEDISQETPPRKARRDRRRNDALKKKRAKRISENSSCFRGYYPVDKHGEYADDEEDVAYYKRMNESHKQTKFLKRQSNKAIRSMDIDEEDATMNGGDYKKVYDYQWELH